MSKALKFCAAISLLFFCDNVLCQVAATSKDTVRIIQILNGRRLRDKIIDSVTTIETIAGNVLLQEGATKFSCDSAAINRHLNILEAFGNIHINQADSIQTYSQYLKYISNERIAYLKKNVKLNDKKGTLYTQDLEYNLTTGIGKYHNGGRVVNGSTTATSKEGVYYADTKDVYFINNVDVIDPKNKIKADSLLYNMQTEGITFIGPTYIINKDGTISTTQGTYDLKKGSGFFGNRSLIKDSSGRTYQANNIAVDEATGNAQMEGNAIIKDSANGYIVTGNQIFLDKKNNSFLATRKPVMIIIQGKDSTYISGDTLFSGVQKKVAPKNISSIKNAVRNDVAKKDSIKITDTKIDVSKMDTLSKTKTINLKNSDTAIRYFNAFNHVRIFNDSLQSVCDSLFYSAEDSVFRLFKNPVIWSGKSQITGDTIYLYTKNKKAERLYVFENGMIISKTKKDFYNQMVGKTLNGYFIDGAIDYMRVKGAKAESIYYPQEEDSSYMGMDRTTADVIELYFINKELNKVLYINDVSGKFYPMRLIPLDMKFLKNFNWLDKLRPKNKLELFE